MCDCLENILTALETEHRLLHKNIKKRRDGVFTRKAYDIGEVRGINKAIDIVIETQKEYYTNKYKTFVTKSINLK